MATHEVAAGWADRAADALARAGYRRGGARAAVIGLLDEQGCALSAFEIEAALAERGARPVARASVYRILEELEALRLVTRLELGRGLARFEPARAEDHHHHMICDACGDVSPFEDAGLERAIERLGGNVEFSVAEHDVTLRGTCRDCRSR
ncbi:MAG: Fur family transcriptional regulator [Solirubrobacteraceae bacterium]